MHLDVTSYSILSLLSFGIERSYTLRRDFVCMSEPLTIGMAAASVGESVTRLL